MGDALSKKTFPEKKPGRILVDWCGHVTGRFDSYSFFLERSVSESLTTGPRVRRRHIRGGPPLRLAA